LFCIDGRYIQDHFPGIGRYTYNLITALARVAPDEEFLILHNPALKNTRYDIVALANCPNIVLQHVNSSTFSVNEQIELSSIVSRLRCSTFHSPYFIKPYFLHVPSLVTIHDLIPIHLPDEVSNPLLRFFFRSAVSLAARTARRVIVPSKSIRDDLVATLHVESEKVVVISEAADPRFKRADEHEISRVQEKYSLPKEYFLFVGINKPHKNLRTLAQAWERSKISTDLVIAGAWDERYGTRILGEPEMKKPILLHNIDDADLPALYSGALVFVMPSLYEGFGLPLLEAMACGAPVISSNAGSLVEVAGNAAQYFSPEDTHELAGLIARVVNNRALQGEMRDKSLARAKEFTWERTARETLAAYRAVGK
jgi:glycosyltransferase involved in cell wall biosynthesis